MSGLLIVDKPAGLTSHDVVARVRRLARTRRVGHAGTLDPMATGVLVVGIEKATRLLGHLALTQKEYAATIRLGQRTDTDDADGQILDTQPAGHVTEAALRAAAAALTGEIMQVPPGVSAIKVGGQRAYKLTRAGAAPELAARPVTISALQLTAIRPAPALPGSATRGSATQDGATLGSAAAGGTLLDIDVLVTCSSGTYIRAIARDLGAALGTGGHLTALRRTRSGPYLAADAVSLDDLAGLEPGALPVIPLAAAAAAHFASRQLTADEARRLSHGGRLPAGGAGQDPLAAFAPDGSLVALLTEEDGQARPLAVFADG
jgi:tRNA pseudouridine55 synthase